MLAGGMTDPKGDRSLPPRAQANQDVFLRVVRRSDDGVWVSGAKAHMTGGWNSHWVVVMPTMHLTEADADCAIVGAIPITAPGITFVYGRQASDGRSLEPGTIDQGNARFGGQEVLVHFDEVFIPHDHVFMDGEVDMAAHPRPTIHPLPPFLVHVQDGAGRRAHRSRAPKWPTPTASRARPTSTTSSWR